MTFFIKGSFDIAAWSYHRKQLISLKFSRQEFLWLICYLELGTAGECNLLIASWEIRIEANFVIEHSNINFHALNYVHERSNWRFSVKITKAGSKDFKLSGQVRISEISYLNKREIVQIVYIGLWNKICHFDFFFENFF